MPSKGFDHITNNIDFYAKKLLQDSIWCIRDANFSESQQQEIMKKLGDYLGWFPNSIQPKFSSYLESHSRTENRMSDNEILVFWHIEHPQDKNPIIAASWNMNKFICNEESGKTYFYNTADMLERMPKEWQDFLLKSKIYKMGNREGTKNFYNKKRFFILDAVQKHWHTEQLTIRMPIIPGIIENILIEYDGHYPTQQEKEYFKKIYNYYRRQIINDADNRLVHKWKQGDFLVPDLFKMAHAVTGGFTPEERSFTGYWAKSKEFYV
jgi:alpha-ketoglutarate-dependent taurine dioxygenase